MSQPATTFSNVLEVVTDSRLDNLAASLASRVTEPLADVMAPEWIAVPSAGLQRWLTLELSRRLGTSGSGRHDGVAGNLDLFFPGTLHHRVLGPEANGDSGVTPDPWDVERMAWVVLEVLQEHGDAPPLAHLARRDDGTSIWRRARHCADLFDRYTLHRPEMIVRWHAGSDVDAAGAPLGDRAGWQPALWRLVRERIGVPSSAELMQDRLSAMTRGDCPDEVPERVSLFGITTIPGGQPFLGMLDALATQRDVHLYLHTPSEVMASEVRRAMTASTAPPRERSEDPGTEVTEHPLLQSWGRSSREASLLLGARVDAVESAAPADRAEHAPTLLAKLQADIRADRAPSEDFTPEPDDRSVRIHSCFGNTRQVEVLRDQILHLLAADPTMTEEDIVVLCPRLDDFAPLIESVFGPSAPTAPRSGTDAADRHGATPSIRYRITDRSLRTTHTLLSAVGALVELLGSRFSDAALLEFASLEPVRTRFRFSDDDLAQLAEWVSTANTRWGLDGEHRSRWGLPEEYDGGSWSAAVGRLMMGVLTSDDPERLAVGEIAPIGVEGSDIAVAGRFGDLLGRLARLTDEVSGMRPISEWVDLLRSASNELFEVDDADSWQTARLGRIFEAIVDSSRIDGVDSAVPLGLGDLRHLVGANLGATAGRPDFFRGGVTISSLTPLRGVPHRAVILLGMDEAAFSVGSPDGDDLTAAAPQIGDRDRRSDTRASLLDSVMAAGSALVMIRNERSVLTNQPVPPAVVLAEFCEVITSTLTPECREAFLDHLDISHPRQAFDARNFVHEPSGKRHPGLDGPWGFDPLARDGALAHGRTIERSPFLPEPLQSSDPKVVSLAELIEFVTNPVKYFLRRVLGISLPDPPERTGGSSPLSDSTGSSGLARPATGSELLIGLDTLEQWGLKDRLFTHLAAGMDLDAFRHREQVGDLLPAGRLGGRVLEETHGMVAPLLAARETLGITDDDPEIVAVDITLADGTRVVGTVRNDRGEEPGPAVVTVSNYAPKRKLGPWLDLLALTLTDPSRPWRSVLVHPARVKAGHKTVDLRIHHTEPEERSAVAAAGMETLVDLFRRGQREPLPIFEALSPALFAGKGAGGAWLGWDGRGDGRDKWNQLAFGHVGLDGILAIEALHDDPDGPATGRAQRYADLLWGTMEHSTSEPDEADEAAVAG